MVGFILKIFLEFVIVKLLLRVVNYVEDEYLVYRELGRVLLGVSG